MATLLCCSNPLPLTAVSFPSSTAVAVAAVHPKPFFVGMRLLQSPTLALHKSSASVSAFVVKAAASEDEARVSEEGAAVLAVDKLPLESKVTEQTEQKARMKLAKKLRLRRKRLVRKRKLRKKGRWPPSKMNKLKNV